MEGDTVAVHVDDAPLEPEVDSKLQDEGVTVLHAPDKRNALQLIHALGMRCLVLISGRTPLRHRFDFLARLRSDYPDCKSRHPVVVVEHGEHDPATAEAPCVVGTTPAKDAHGILSFVRSILQRLGWRS